jgi:hypothetical protein
MTWENKARDVLRREKIMYGVPVARKHPGQKGFVAWQDSVYSAYLQAPFKDEPEIILMSKTRSALEPALIQAILKLENRTMFAADEDLKLEETVHVLGKVDERLTWLTSEQFGYINKWKTRNYRVSLIDLTPVVREAKSAPVVHYRPDLEQQIT